MKGLQFFGNRVEDAANAFIDVLKEAMGMDKSTKGVTVIIK